MYEKKIAIPMLLCVGAINNHLIKNKLRGYVSINVQTGEVLDTHSFATLIRSRSNNCKSIFST